VSITGLDWVGYWRVFLRFVPGMYPDAPKRNLLFVLLYIIVGSVTAVTLWG
jgi:hypothetical protein